MPIRNLELTPDLCEQPNAHENSKDEITQNKIDQEVKQKRVNLEYN